MREFSILHQKLIDFNTEIGLMKKSANVNHLNFTKLEYFTGLGDVLPKRVMQTNLSIWPIILYLCAVIFCLGSSTIFHWFYPMNKKLYSVLHRCDLSGICILIFGSCFSIIYYAFYCDLTAWITWLALVGVSCCGTFILSMFDWFHKEKYVKVKSIIYASCGIFGAAAFINIGIQSYIYGTDLKSDNIRF